MNFTQTLASAFLGKPVATSGYNAATSGRRMIGAGMSSTGVSTLAMSDGQMLTARARKAVMDNPRADILVSNFVAEVVGTGLRPHWRHPNVDIRQKLEQEFALWAVQSSATRRLGPDGKPDSLQDFYCQQGLVCRNVIEAGEAFGRLRYRMASDLSPTGLRVPLQIDLLEPEQLAPWRMSGDMASPQNLVRASIEFNPIHERVAYHFYREHPGDSTLWPNSWEITRVPAGEVLHVMEFIRGNQIRGLTKLAPILAALADVDGFDDATRFRQKLGAYLFAWRKTMTPDESNINLTGTAGADTAPQGAAYVEMQPGQLNILDSNINEEFDFYAHPGVENTYKDFMRIQDQLLATAGRITYDMFTGDGSQANFSSQRARLVNLRRIWRQFQRSVLEHQFCRPILKPWLDAAALAGVIDARDYKKNQLDYLNVEWLPQPWEYVDPVKDITALRMKVESAFMSREQAVSSFGDDVQEVDQAIKRDHDREAQLGIVPVYGASRVTETVPPGDNEDLAESEPAPPATEPKPVKTPPKKTKVKK
ncbi:MAG TPA: phage portal protein [Bryobacteraceae bacterium]|jgi:lambda family phage portal protein